MATAADDAIEAALVRLDFLPPDPAEAMGEVAAIVADVNAAASLATDWTGLLAERLKELIAKLYERLRRIAVELMRDNEVSFTLSAGVPLGVSFTVIPTS
jgi:hypothetical protein